MGTLSLDIFYDSSLAKDGHLKIRAQDVAVVWLKSEKPFVSPFDDIQDDNA